MEGKTIMGAPNLTVTIEPTEAGSVVCGPMASAIALTAALPQFAIALKLAIVNNEPNAIHVNKIDVSFVGPSAVAGKTIPVSLNIGAKQTVSWFMSTADTFSRSDAIPPKIRLGLTCTGFDAQASVVKPLTAYKNSTASGSYRFPGRASDLRPGEFWSGRSLVHSPDGTGGQLFGYDLGVMAWDAARSVWSATLPGKDGSKNEHYRIWGKPIRAMAAGTVVTFANDRPNNPSPPAALSPPDPVEGNHFYIQHGDELVLYAHLQKGSLTPTFMKNKATVKEGDVLGLAGNSGHSSGPHLHVHAIQATQPFSGPLRPLLFNSLHVVARDTLAPVTWGPPSLPVQWVKVNGKILPYMNCALWPEASPPT
jgi:hypothetical protein